jgi:hypothetical protein
MNELQLLQQAYSNGTITPQQAERLKQLMAGQGAQGNEPTRDEVIEKGEYNSQTDEYCYEGVCFGGGINPDRKLFNDIPNAIRRTRNEYDNTIDFSKMSEQDMMDALNRAEKIGDKGGGIDLSDFTQEQRDNIPNFLKAYKEYQVGNQRAFGTTFNVSDNNTNLLTNWTDFENQYMIKKKNDFGFDMPQSIIDSGQYTQYRNENLPKEVWQMDNLKLNPAFEQSDLPGGLVGIEGRDLKNLPTYPFTIPSPQTAAQTPNQDMFGKPTSTPTKVGDEATQAYYDQNSGQWKQVDVNNKYDLSNIFGNKPSAGISPDNTVNNKGQLPISPRGESWSEVSNPDITNPYTPYEPSWTTQKNPNAVDLTDPSKMSLIGPHAYQGNGNEGEGMPKADMFRFPMINPGGSDLSTEIYSLGRALGSEKGTPGRGMNIVGAGGAAALYIARNLASGIGFSKRNQYVMDWYKKKQQERTYTPDSQSEDQNSMGGFKLGGTINMFAEDGMMMPEGQPQEQMPQEQGQDQQMQQVVQMIAGMLQQGANPQQVLEELVRQGVPQQEAEQLIQMVIQQMQGQQAPAPEQQQPQDQQMMMKNGGTFDKRVGESVTIKVGGKKVKGVIKEIKNGQITLK